MAQVHDSMVHQSKFISYHIISYHIMCSEDVAAMITFGPWTMDMDITADMMDLFHCQHSIPRKIFSRSGKEP